ncbi:unnamed protein product, partial [Iphiclides podalirius]
MLQARQNLMRFKHLCSVSYRNYQVAITGAGSEIGQTISLLLRTNPSISKLVLHDTLQYTPGVVLDLSHIPSKSKVKGYVGEDTLDEALQGSNLVIAAGGIPQHSDNVNRSILSKNADFIKEVASSVSLVSPLPFFGIVTEPINTLVPLAAEAMRNQASHDPNKLFGITGVDALQAQTLYARESALIQSECIVPVIGGHSRETMVPLFSQATPRSKLTEEKSQELTAILRNATPERSESHSPTLSVAYAVSIFVNSVLEALNGETVQVNALVENNDFGTSFFSGLVDVGPKGVSEMRTYTDLYHHECVLLESSIKQLHKDVDVGKKIMELV